MRKPSAAMATDDLKTLIHDHSLFFDRLVELIPARFYLATADNDRTPIRHLPKADKIAAREETRLNIKKSRRDRLDPQKSSTTTLDLLKKNIDAEKKSADSDSDTGRAHHVSDDRAVTYEELRHRLRSRIEDLRSNRNTHPSDDPEIEKGGDKTLAGKRKRDESKEGGDTTLAGEQKHDESKEEEDETLTGKQKSDGSKNGGDKTPSGHKTPSGQQNRDESKNGNDETLAGKRKRDEEKFVSSAATADIAFGQVKLGDDDEESRRRRKKVSKAQALERAKRLAEAKKDPEKGEVVSKKHSWKAAASRAEGIKVHDEPRLIQKSIKKEKKRQEKHTEQWKERIQSRDKVRAEKQKTRADNIKERVQKKKTRRIEKREKKLMRPGFEGRREGYINE